MLVDDFNPLERKQFQIIDQNGAVVDSKREPKLDSKLLLDMYYWMRLSRVADEKGLKMQRSGRMGTFAPASGQEAAQVGSAIALKKEDWMVPSFREPAAMFTRGVPIASHFMYFMGDERGNMSSDGANNIPVSIPVGSQIVHATGIAWASKIKKEKAATLVFFGDGATSEGEFHEGLNFAGVLKSPIVFLCQNNQYAISVPRSKQTAAKTIAQKAYAYGFKGIQVDGNDILAVYVTAMEALENARKGNGPTLIEAVTYRQLMHTTADDPKKYRDPKEEAEWLSKDPIKRFKKYLQTKKILTDAKEKEIEERVQETVAEGVKIAEESDEPPLEGMFQYLYAEMTPNLKDQLESLKESIATKEIEDDQETIEGGFP